MRNLLVLALVFGVASACVSQTAVAQEKDSLIGDTKLLPGYKHEKLQGIDSIVGKIINPKGLSIFYEIGAIPKGQFRFGGSFTDRPKTTQKSQLRWYKEQKVLGQPVHIAYLKNGMLLVSYPESIPGKGINFSTKIQSPTDMADALIMLLTFPKPKPKPAKDAAAKE